MNEKRQMPEYIKPQIVVSYTKDELKEEFKELQGQSAIVDLFSLYEGPEKMIHEGLEKKISDSSDMNKTFNT